MVATLSKPLDFQKHFVLVIGTLLILVWFLFLYSVRPLGVTSIGHNATTEVLNNGFEDPGSFHLYPSYGATLGQMKALTAVSQNCSQFIKVMVPFDVGLRGVVFDASV